MGAYCGSGIVNMVPKSRGCRKIKLSFSSAWTSPTPVVEKLSLIYPRLLFKMNSYECGMGEKWGSVFKGGFLLSEFNKPYHGRRGG